MATELEKLLGGEYVDTSSPELRAAYLRTIALWKKLNATEHATAEYREALRELIPGFPDSSTIMTPFYCDYGHIVVGENVFINFNCTFLDGGGITIGDNTLIGPTVQIYTPIHPTDHIERRSTVERSPAVRIGADCWIAGNVTILPGVSIGDRCIIGAGSVVTRDIPADSFAAGNPAVVKRSLAK